MEYSRRRKLIPSFQSVQSGSLVELYPCDLQLYQVPPLCKISLTEFEEIAHERMKILRTVDQINLRGLIKSSEEWKGALIVELKKLGLKGFAKLLNGTGCGRTESELQARKRDHISHFIMRLAYCRTEELRRSFISRELDLFRVRFNSLNAEGIKLFMQTNNLKYEPISGTEKSQLRECLYESTYMMTSVTSVEVHEYYRVPFTYVQDLVRSRKVYLYGGYAYVPSTDFISILSTVFRTTLAHGIAMAARMLPSMECDERVFRLLKDLHERYTGEESTTKSSIAGSVSIAELDSLSRHSFPPCMRYLHENLRSTHHMRHGGRMQYGLFLKGIGLSMEDALRFWREEFSKNVGVDKFEKNYAYNIRHNYGKEGKRTNYTPYSCMKIIMSSVGPEDAHGCPFRHSDMVHLKQRLLGWNVSTTGIGEIADYVSQGHYQLACGKYFQLLHGVNVGINHPNQYFAESQSALTGKQSTKSTVTGSSVAKPKDVAPKADDMWDDDMGSFDIDMQQIEGL